MLTKALNCWCLFIFSINLQSPTHSAKLSESELKGLTFRTCYGREAPDAAALERHEYLIEFDFALFTLEVCVGVDRGPPEVVGGSRTY